MEKLSIGQYRSHDQPKNFAVKIKFSKVKPELGIPSARFSAVTSGNPELAQEALNLATEGAEDKDTEEHIIHWQEKLFNEFEFDEFGIAENCTSSVTKKYHQEINNIKSSLGFRPNKRISTLVDGDEFWNKETEDSVTMAQNEMSTDLAQKMDAAKKLLKKQSKPSYALRRRGLVMEKPTESVKSNHIISTQIKQMQIMVDVGDKSTRTSDNYCDIRMLCSIKIDGNGLVVTEPDIKKRESIKLEVYHNVRTVYHYTIEDASISITKLQKSQEASLYNELYNRHSQLRQIHVGNELTPLPRSNELIMYSFCEIVSAKNFEYNSLYIQYYLDFPAGWESLCDNLFGVTHSCSMNKDDVAHFCFPIDFELLQRWPEENPGDFLRWPTLYIEVYSLDSWDRHRIEGYGYCQLPDVAGSTLVQVDTWRPKDDDMFADMRRFFIGGTRELKDTTYTKTPGDNEEMKNSKFYFQTITSGSVLLRFNTMLQTNVAPDKVSAASKWKKAVQKTGVYTAATDSLSQVLDAFHHARKRMLAARATLPQG